MPINNHASHKESCPVSVALEVFGGKWKLQIIWILHAQSHRFGELKRLLPGISEKILIQQLKQLVDDGIVLRHQFPEVPPRVEYSLTEKGQTLLPVLEGLKLWAEEHLMPHYLSKKDLAFEPTNSLSESTLPQ
ncbi:MAG: winged helix-turn-helix transcriptional regulator [Bdellovibrionia bacterium]